MNRHDFFFFIFYGLQLFLAVAVGRPIPHTAHPRDCSTGSIGYPYEVRPTFRLLPLAISPTHCTTRTQLTIIDSICHTVFARGFATTSVATHLTLNHGFPIIRLSQPGGCMDPTGSLAERQRRSPRGCSSTATGNRTLDPRMGRDDHRTALLSHLDTT